MAFDRVPHELILKIQNILMIFPVIITFLKYGIISFLKYRERGILTSD